jgi:hypothetical protein
MSIVYTSDPAREHPARNDAFSDSTAATILERQFERDVTCGNWVTELEAETELDRRLGSTGLFRIYRQVEGRSYANTPTDDIKGYRIDRVIVPTAAAKGAGWTLGPVGIECKRSGIKIGKPVSQALDYRRAFWHLEESPETWFTLGWVFVWPTMPQAGPILSVMAQNRVGTAWPNEAGGLTLGTAGRSLAHMEPGKPPHFDRKADSVGRKVGSR